MGKCTHCSAVLSESADWCGQCGVTVMSEADAQALLAEATSPGSRAAVLPQWRPPERHTAPSPPAEYSRVKGGPLSLSLRGKIAVSSAALLVGLYFLLYANSPGSGMILLAVTPVLLRDVWRRRRIR